MKIRFTRNAPEQTSRRLLFSGETHIGLVREVNEDCFCYIDYPQDYNSLAVVADGIGGHESGDVASSLCCRRFVAGWKNSQAGKYRSVEKIKKYLENEIINANRDIYNQNCRKQLAQPMGTTVVAVVFSPSKVIVAHAGDSRLYSYFNGKLMRLTQDHSFVAELVKKQVITEEESETHPFAHIISKSVGPTMDVDPEINVFLRSPGARYMLCSDGLLLHVSEDRIAAILAEHKTPKAALNQFMKETLIKGGEDNVTVICAF